RLLLRPGVAAAGGERAARDSWGDGRRPLERLVAELAEPVAVLGHEVEREPIRPGRKRPADDDLRLDVPARTDLARKPRPEPVPDDRVPELVEPVIAEADAP